MDLPSIRFWQDIACQFGDAVENFVQFRPGDEKDHGFYPEFGELANIVADGLWRTGQGMALAAFAKLQINGPKGQIGPMNIAWITARFLGGNIQLDGAMGISAGVVQQIGRVVGLSDSVLFDQDDPQAPVNRRISIIVMNKKTAAGIQSNASRSGEPLIDLTAPSEEEQQEAMKRLEEGSWAEEKEEPKPGELNW
jgi:hypothetical protein